MKKILNVRRGYKVLKFDYGDFINDYKDEIAELSNYCYNLDTIDYHCLIDILSNAADNKLFDRVDDYWRNDGYYWEDTDDELFNNGGWLEDEKNRIVYNGLDAEVVEVKFIDDYGDIDEEVILSWEDDISFYWNFSKDAGRKRIERAKYNVDDPLIVKNALYKRVIQLKRNLNTYIVAYQLGDIDKLLKEV